MIRFFLENPPGVFADDPLFRKAFAWLRERSAAAPLGRSEIGDGVFAGVDEYETHPFNPEHYEAHRRYIDVQFVAEGEETVFVAPLDGAETRVPFDAGKDVGFYAAANGEAVPVRSGECVVLFPDDAHAPGAHPASGGPSRVRKIVVKIPAPAV